MLHKEVIFRPLMFFSLNFRHLYSSAVMFHEKLKEHEKLIEEERSLKNLTISFLHVPHCLLHDQHFVSLSNEIIN